MRLRQLRLVGVQMVPVLVLLVCAPVVWSQSFSTEVKGEACGVKYDNRAPLEIQGTTDKVSCGNNGTGSATSLVNLTTDQMSGGASFAIESGKAKVQAESISNDTVTLIPPKGFTGTDIIVHLGRSYSTTITGNSGGVVYFCWDVPKLLVDNCHEVSSSTAGVVTAGFTVTKSASGFKFPLKTTVTAEGDGEGKNQSGSWGYDTFPDAIIKFSQMINGKLEPAKGWKCRFASGHRCQ